MECIIVFLTNDKTHLYRFDEANLLAYCEKYF